jgi:hypothetical protein
MFFKQNFIGKIRTILGRFEIFLRLLPSFEIKFCHKEAILSFDTASLLFIENQLFKIATARVHPALAPLIFAGKHATLKPKGGN